MPRTKGSKNILNAKELKSEIERLKNGTSVSETKIPDSPVSFPSPVSIPKPNKAIDVKIKVPVKKKTKTVASLTKTYGCGNQLCTYESETKFSTCPVCGVNNTWSSDK